MPNDTGTQYDTLARRMLADAPHYLESVVALAEREDVVASADIFAADGTKVADRGSALDGASIRRLLKQKLLKPTGIVLDIADSFMSGHLAQRAAQMIDEDSWLKLLAERSGDPLAMRHALARLPLPPQLSFLLSLAREQRPQLFDHLLEVTLIAQYLALTQGYSERKTENLLIAALSHDIGELHTDPALLDRRHRIRDDELRFIYVHPITSHLIMREIEGLDPAVAAAVLQHQERLDGSGYPYGLRGEQIGPLARILGIADVCAAILTRFGSNERLSALIRLNQQKFDGRLIGAMLDGFRRNDGSAHERRLPQLSRLIALSRLIERWGSFRAALCDEDRAAPPPQLDFLFERMVALRTTLLQFGFDPESQQLLIALAADDAGVAAELAAALDEVQWQFNDLSRELARRHADIAPTLSPVNQAMLESWIGEFRSYLEAIED